MFLYYKLTNKSQYLLFSGFLYLDIYVYLRKQKIKPFKSHVINTEESVKKLKKIIEATLPLLTGEDSLKFACLPFQDGLDSELFMNRIIRTNQKYPRNRCLFILSYENGSLKIDYKVREKESVLTIIKDGQLLHRRTETDLGISPAELFLLSMYLHVRYFVINRHTEFKTITAGNKITYSTIS